MVNGEVANTYNIISARIQPVLSPQLTAYIDTPGWEVGLSDDNDLLIVKPPLIGDVYQQWVMNIQTGAWSTFTSMPMNVWTTYNGQMWFGTADGNVCLGLDSDLDGVGLDGTGGEEILATLQGGFSDFGTPANLKTFSLVRPIFLAQVNPSVSVQINIDYAPNPIYSSSVFTPSEAAVWDSAHWDNAVWSAGEDSFAAWSGVQGLGYYGSLKMAVVGKAYTKYISSTIIYQTGGVM
jgi:phospholipase C